MIHFLKILFFIIFSVNFSYLASAAQGVDEGVRAAAIKYAKNDFSNINHTPLSALPGTNSPRTLSKNPAPENNYRKYINRADDIFKKNQSMNAFMILKEGFVIFEDYKEIIQENSLLLSASMAKSLTAMTLGGVICDKKQIDINESMGYYSPRLKGTMFSEVKIFNALRMASGNVAALEYGQTIKNMNGRMITKKGDLDIPIVLSSKYSKQEIPQGTSFRYGNADTLAVAELISDLTSSGSMLPAFRKYVWDKVNAEASGVWLTDRRGNLIASGGFLATLRDWARLSLWVLDESKKDSCFSRYIKEMSSDKISGLTRESKDGQWFQGYGYQTWVHSGGSFWWNGRAGQRVGFDKDKNIIFITFGYSNKYIPSLYKLFLDFQKNK
jgi:CubicO group peptidase (beta-lactamase class C family)